jgi:hypothetical protein
MQIIDILSPLIILTIVIMVIWYCLVTIGPWFVMSILITGYLIFCLIIEYIFFDE